MVPYFFSVLPSRCETSRRFNPTFVAQAAVRVRDFASNCSPATSAVIGIQVIWPVVLHDYHLLWGIWLLNITCLIITSIPDRHSALFL